ncbi:hypothetical protein XELAEV_18026630mg [Xenopus laevis]|uniref:Secreted protein n=1 Tax=Xenopus laevis TaxID=8355 RepID=A0A974HJ11_XENLA|nr:hypothetical protein XELAEV_18026630mg [Xenopus laevis]
MSPLPGTFNWFNFLLLGTPIGPCLGGGADTSIILCATPQKVLRSCCGLSRPGARALAAGSPVCSLGGVTLVDVAGEAGGAVEGGGPQVASTIGADLPNANSAVQSSQ